MFDLRGLEAAEQLQLVTISKCNCNHRLARYLPWLQYIREGKNLTRKVWFRLNVLQNGVNLKQVEKQPLSQRVSLLHSGTPSQPWCDRGPTFIFVSPAFSRKKYLVVLN